MNRIAALGALRAFLIGRLHSFAQKPRKDAGSLLDFLARPATSLDVSSRFGWDEAATKRVLKALEGAGILAGGRPDGRRAVNPDFTAPPVDDVQEWMNLGGAGFLALRSYSEVKASRIGLASLPSLRGIDLDSDPEARGLLWFCRFVLSRFLSEETIVDTLKTGRCRASVVLGMSTDQIFNHYPQQPILLATFAASFSTMNREANGFAATASRLPKNAKVLDVGGGVGGLAAALAASETTARIDIYDHPDSAPVLGPLEGGWIGPFGGRIKRLYGDLFLSEDGGFAGLSSRRDYDRVFLAWVLNDWNDEQCVGILRRAARQLAPQGEVVVLEKLRSDEASYTDVADFVLFLITGGRERSLPEYEALFAAADLDLSKLCRNAAGRDVMMLTRRGS